MLQDMGTDGRGGGGYGEPGEDRAFASAAAVYGLLTSLLRRAPRDISLTSAATLSTLDRTGPRRITELATVQGVTQPSMTTLITSLERAGLVERNGDPHDKRVALVSITDAGRRYVSNRRRAGTESFAVLVGKLPPDEAAALAAAIPAMNHLLDLDNEQTDAAARRP